MSSKKIIVFFTLFVLIIFGIVFFFAFQKDFENGDGASGDQNGKSEDVIAPIVAFSDNTLSDRSWLNKGFFVHLKATDFGGPNDTGFGSIRDLAECKYVVNESERLYTCNSSLFLAIGQDSTNDCFTQGTNDSTEGVQYTCSLTVYAIDHTGNETLPENRPSRLYGIDWTAPFVSNVYGIKAEDPLSVFIGELFEYRAMVQEKESRVLGCGFFVKQENESQYQNKGAMDISQLCQRECEASFLYQFDEPGEYSIRVICQDVAGNYGFGKTSSVSFDINDAPEISSCRVTPIQGNRGESFTFEVIAKDPDGDTLLYGWEFGDGNFSFQAAPTHRYLKEGTYTPLVRVLDGKGGETMCFTAWVVVEEL